MTPLAPIVEKKLKFLLFPTQKDPFIAKTAIVKEDLPETDTKYFLD
jgi:hypothetical protein